MGASLSWELGICMVTGKVMLSWIVECAEICLLIETVDKTRKLVLFVWDITHSVLEGTWDEKCPQRKATVARVCMHRRYTNYETSSWVFFPSFLLSFLLLSLPDSFLFSCSSLWSSLSFFLLHTQLNQSSSSSPLNSKFFYSRSILFCYALSILKLIHPIENFWTTLSTNLYHHFSHSAPLRKTLIADHYLRIDDFQLSLFVGNARTCRR